MVFRQLSELIACEIITAANDKFARKRHWKYILNKQFFARNYIDVFFICSDTSIASILYNILIIFNIVVKIEFCPRKIHYPICQIISKYFVEINRIFLYINNEGIKMFKNNVVPIIPGRNVNSIIVSLPQKSASVDTFHGSSMIPV